MPNLIGKFFASLKGSGLGKLIRAMHCSQNLLGRMDVLEHHSGRNLLAIDDAE